MADHSITIESNTFTGSTYKMNSTFFDINYGGPVTFTSNSFESGYTGKLNSGFPMVGINLMCSEVADYTSTISFVSNR